MKADSPSGHRLRFGEFRLDTRTGELAKGGSPIHLPPQPARVLALLASRPGELVTREELRGAVWGGDTHVEFDQALNFCIRRIRAALQDDAEAPRFIETLARRGYRFVASVRREAGVARELARSGRGSAGVRRAMLVVLPFENLSRDPEQDYFGAGLTEEMIAHLGRLDPESLGVIARTSSMRYKGTRKSAADIARELGVQYLLEGSVRVSEDRVRVSAQLIRASDQTHVWAGLYDRPLRDILGVQADVARSIAREIRLKLTPETSGRLERVRTVDPGAYQSYLRGLHFMSHSSSESCKSCLACFEHSLRCDPDFAPAHAGLSVAWARMAFHGLLAPREAWRRAREAAERAIAIDDECADGHASLARVEMEFAWDWQKAETESLRALALNPNHLLALHWLSHLHVVVGRLGDSLAVSLRAVELDPFDAWINAHLAWHHIHARDYDEAVSVARRALGLDPNSVQSRIHLGWALLEAGAREEAIAELAEAASPARGENNEALWALGHAAAVAGHTERARAILGQIRERGCEASFGRALIHVGLGEIDAAFACLDESCEERYAQMIYLRLDPRFDPLRLDARIEKLARRLGLPG